MPEPARSVDKRQQAQPRKKVGPRRAFEALRERRMPVADLFERGKRQVDVVAEVGVSALSVSRWHRAGWPAAAWHWRAPAGPGDALCCPTSR